MFSFFKRSRLPEGQLSQKEKERMLKRWQKQAEAWFKADPFENRCKFARDLREKAEEWKDTMDPKLVAELRDIAKDFEAEGLAHGLALAVDVLKAELDEWEKQDHPPFREIIRWENDLPDLLRCVKDIPEHMREGATKDLQLLQQRLAKILE